jgi:hypothetical protein
MQAKTRKTADHLNCFRLERFAGWDLHPLESAAFHGAHSLPTFRFEAMKRLEITHKLPFPARQLR